MNTHEELAAQKLFEQGVSAFLRDRWEGNKDIEKGCESLAKAAPDLALGLLVKAIGKAQEKWKADWRFCMSDTPSGLAKALCSVASKCSDCCEAVPYLQELAFSSERAVEALGFTKDERVIDWLMEHKVAGDAYSFDPKYASIGRLGGPKAAKILVSHIEKPAARKMLGEIGNDAIPYLADALDQGKFLAWLPLKTLGWRPQTVNQQIWVAILEQDSHLPEIVGPQHFEQVADCFDAAGGNREYWETAGITSESRLQFRNRCAKQILKNAEPALWLRLMSDRRWYAGQAAKVAAEFGDSQTLAEFVRVCSCSGVYADEMTRMANRFPKVAEDLFLQLAVKTSAATSARLSAAAWLLSHDHPESYRIILELTLENVGSGYLCNEWSRVTGNNNNQWSRVTGISENLLDSAYKALKTVSGSAKFITSESLREMEEAVEKLCSMRNPLSSAILQRIAVRPDGEMSIGPEFHETRHTVDLSQLRAKAQVELNSRSSESESIDNWYRKNIAMKIDRRI